MSIGYHTFNISSDKTKGLTHAIDAELDNLYNCDIQLSANEWQSIFDKIKSDQATQEGNQSQFGKNDNDITKGNQYVVNSGVYRVTENVWNYITNVAENWVTNNQAASTKDNDAKAVNNNEQPASNAEQPDGYDIETKVLDVLKKNNIDYSDIEVHDIVNKYKTILEFNKANGIEIDDTKLEERIANYAKGMKAHVIETKFANAWDSETETDIKLENSAVKQAVTNGDMNAFKAAFHQAAKEYIELYDNAEGDGKIDVNELIQMEPKELGQELTPEQITIVQQEAVNRVAILDQNGDNKLDENEIAAYLWATSKINDGVNDKTADDITFEEWKIAQESMGILSIPEGEATQEDIDKYAKFEQALKNGYNGLK